MNQWLVTMQCAKPGHSGSSRHVLYNTSASVIQLGCPRQTHGMRIEHQTNRLTPSWPRGGLSAATTINATRASGSTAHHSAVVALSPLCSWSQMRVHKSSRLDSHRAVSSQAVLARAVFIRTLQLQTYLLEHSVLAQCPIA